MRHWSHLKIGQRVHVEIAELGFSRIGRIKYIGGVNGHYALNEKYHLPSLESGEGLEPWIGIELDDPLPFRQSHHGRETSGRFWFSCAQDCGYWAHAHQIGVLKRDPKYVGDLERRKQTTVELGPILKKDVDKSYIRSFYEDRDAVYDLAIHDRAILEDSEDELENADLDKKYGRKLCYGCDDDFRQRYRDTSDSKYYTQSRSIPNKTSDQAVQTQIDNALETVRRSKKYLESIDSRNFSVKSAKVVKDSTDFGMYLDSLKDRNSTHARNHEILRETPRMVSPPNNGKFYPRNQTLGGPSRLKSQLLPRTGTTASIPMCHSETFLMTY